MTDDINIYYNLKLSRREIKKGKHRDDVGGLWEEIGSLQFRFLLDHGLKPSDRLLDVGCGCFRGGVYFIEYLEAGNYYGIDVNSSLLHAGYNIELRKRGLQWKVPRTNILQDGEFSVERFGVVFDYAIAISVFTHLPIDLINLCLNKVANVMKPGGRFFATFFEVPNDHSLDTPFTHMPGGVTTYHDRDPYHYRLDSIEQCIKGLPWQVTYIGEWQHPRAQKMLCFTKMEGNTG